MKYLFIGLGSIGMRHLENLRSLTDEPIYALRTKVDKKIDKKYNITSTTSIQEAISWKPNVVFITNPTYKHLPYALIFSNSHLFIEKPISINSVVTEYLLKKKENNNKIRFVGYNYRFHPSIREIKNQIDKGEIGKILFAHFQQGQYLPSWHPKEDYRKSYASKEELGGGALLTLSHDIDLAYWFFGEMKSVYAQMSKVSSLEIDTEDIVSIILETKAGAIVTINLDYLQPTNFHSIKVVGENNMVEWNYNCNYMRDKTFNIELQYFLNCVKARRKPKMTNKDIIYVMKIMDACRESSGTGRKVYL